MGDRFAGKIAVVTGAASGIGLATAKMFSGEGATVVIVDLNGEGAEKVAAEINAGGGQAAAMQCDIANQAQVEQCAQDVVARYGQIDILVNNAGISITAIAEDYDLFDKSVAINLCGAFYWAKAD